MLPEFLEEFIARRRIDSFYKVWFLLFLHRHSAQRQFSRAYVRQIAFTDASTLDEVIEELHETGLLSSSGGSLSLERSAEVHRGLDGMALAYEDPRERRKLLRRMYRRPTREPRAADGRAREAAQS